VYCEAGRQWASPGPTLDGIEVPHVVPFAAVLGATQVQALVVLFVVLPFVVAAATIAFVSWRSKGDPPPVRTSTILAEGYPAEAEVLAVKTLGGFLDMRPMVRFSLQVNEGPGEAPYELEVVQSLPREVAREIRAGDVLEVRLTADRSAGAVVWGGPATPGREHRP
jgi:hypothetical protein